ncbi:HD-GYP domain-containing protein [Roseimaritima sediminicola]|uniref:HD-GYP domain-containing protein n=1 Tax=Roseimaritima sediminicola TaxID=2662066 RepID=UPI0012983D75|nr:HD-GYP domain-containing protein [Roseimaritima sediminicola]
MSTCYPILSGQQLTLINQTRLNLNQRFDASFTVWYLGSEGLQELVGHAEAAPSSLKEQMHRLVARGGITGGCVCEPVEGGGDLVVQVLPVGASDFVLIAGHSDRQRLQLSQELAESAHLQAEQTLELQESRSCLVEYADQVTNDFEELAWLRRLAEHIEACDLKSDMQTVCEAILPPLRELINAETIALIQPTGTDAQDAFVCAYRLGDLPIDLDRFQDLLTACPIPLGQPFVCNATEPLAASGATFGMRNFILVRISRSGTEFGWLLVANRAVIGTGATDLRVNASCLNGWEFGTFEAGIVNAAAVMLGTHARNSQLFCEREDLLLGVVRALINAVDAKDAYTCGHSDRVALFAQRIARKMNLSAVECERIYMAGLLHDIGKIGIPDQVLCKAGRLSDAEYETIKQHPEIGYSILRHVKQLEYVLPGVLHHHESYDGKGYPHGLAGQQIPVYGRVLAVADSFDAMTSTRSYRKAMPHAKAIAILTEGAGTQWDPAAVQGLLEALPEIEQICQAHQPDKVVDDERVDGTSPFYGARIGESCDALTAALSALGDAS